MAGAFVLSVYERNNGTFGAIRVQPETITAFNPAAGGTLSGQRIRARGSSRRYGTRARGVTLSRAVGSGADFNAAKVQINLPILTKSAWDALSDGQILTYQGINDWQVAGKYEESNR